MIGLRIKEERERLSITQQGIADAIGIAKRTLIDWEKDRTSPTAVQLSELSGIGVDVLYVITGIRASIQPSFNENEGVDEALFKKVIAMLVRIAKKAGKRWDSEQLVDMAFRVYNYLKEEDVVDDEKITRTLKLVVND